MNQLLSLAHHTIAVETRVSRQLDNCWICEHGGLHVGLLHQFLGKCPIPAICVYNKTQHETLDLLAWPVWPIRHRKPLKTTVRIMVNLHLCTSDENANGRVNQTRSNKAMQIMQIRVAQSRQKLISPTTSERMECALVYPKYSVRFCHPKPMLAAPNALVRAELKTVMDLSCSMAGASGVRWTEVSSAHEKRQSSIDPESNQSLRPPEGSPALWAETPPIGALCHWLQAFDWHWEVWEVGSCFHGGAEVKSCVSSKFRTRGGPWSSCQSRSVASKVSEFKHETTAKYHRIRLHQSFCHWSFAAGDTAEVHDMLHVQSTLPAARIAAAVAAMVAAAL